MQDSNLWDLVRKKVNDSRAAIESAWNPPYPVRMEILKRRARKLASGRQQVDRAEENLDVLVFELSTEQYGIESAHVDEVLQLTDYTPLPFTPSWIMGIVPVRGRFVSIINIRNLFGMQHRGIGDLNEIIIIKSSEMEFGILAEKIKGIQIIMRSEIRTGIHIPGISENYIQGVSSELIILDTGKLLTDNNLIIGSVGRSGLRDISNQGGITI